MWALFKSDSKKLINIFVLLTGFYTLGYLLAGFSKTDTATFATIVFYGICSIAIFVTALFNFQYLHEKTSATHILSLPFSKIQLCIIRYLSGLLLIVIPSVIYIVAISVTKNFDMANFMTSALLFIFIYYTLGCIVANLTGTTIMHIFVYAMVCFVPTLLYISLSTVIAQYVHGMVSPDISMSIIQLLLPASSLVMNTIDFTYTMIYLGYSLALFGMLLFIAHQRPFEKTGEPVAFERIDDIVKFLIIISLAWLLMAFMAVVSNVEAILPVTCIFASIIVTIVIELIFNKKLKIMRVCIQIVSIGVITIAMYFATSKYLQYYIPSSTDSAILTINEGTYNYGLDGMKCDDPATISMIKEIHEYLADDLIRTTDGTWSVTIFYALENKDRVERNYIIDEPIYNKIKDIFNAHPKEYITLMDAYYKNIEKTYTDEMIESFSIVDGEQYDSIEDQKAVEILKRDIKIQIQRFKENPDLYKQIDFIGSRYRQAISLILRGEHRYYENNVYKNDPIYFAIEGFNKEIKAN